MLNSKWNSTTQITSANSSMTSSTPLSINSTNIPTQESSQAQDASSTFFRKSQPLRIQKNETNISLSPFRKKMNHGALPNSTNEPKSNSPSFLSNGTQTSNPTYQYYASKNQSAIPVSIILRNQHITDKTRRRLWRNHSVHLMKTTLEIFYEEEITGSSLRQQSDPIYSQASDVSALSSNDSDSMESQSSVDKSRNFSSNQPKKQRYVVYSKEHTASLHSSWNNLTDLLQSLHGDLMTESGKEDWYQDARYETMKAHVFVSSHEMQRIHNFHLNQHQHENEEDSVESNNTLDKIFDPTLMNPTMEMNALGSKEKKLTENSILTIGMIPLHPTYLRRLPPSHNNSNRSPSKAIVPSALPPNTLIVEYSDGSLRVLPPLYKLLLKKNIINEKSFDMEGTAGKDNLEADRINENKRTIRFSDNAFEALETAKKNVVRDEKKSGNNFGFETYPKDSVNFLLTDTNSINCSLAREVGESEMHDASRKNEVFNNIETESSNKNETEHGLQTKETELPPDNIDKSQNSAHENENISFQREYYETDSHERKLNIGHFVKSGNQQNNSWHSQELEDENATLTQKIEYLEKVIKLEEAALNEDELELRIESAKVKTLMEDILSMEKNSAMIRYDTEKLIEKFSYSEFLVSTRQSKLIKELTQIYPIKSLSKYRYAIRNLEIPTDLNMLFHSSAHDDPHISSALGYTSHVVYMCSKYLSLPLRYKLICNASRSAIQGDQNGNLFPLFKEKVEKDQFDMAVSLLDRNVDCLLTGKWRVDVGTCQNMNMLDKLNRLFARVMLIDHKEKDFV